MEPEKYVCSGLCMVLIIVFQAIERVKELNKQTLAKKYQQAKAPKLRTDGIRSTLEKAKTEVQAQREAELQFNKKLANPVPVFPEVC